LRVGLVERRRWIGRHAEPIEWLVWFVGQQFRHAFAGTNVFTELDAWNAWRFCRSARHHWHRNAGYTFGR
jgi:hypothetical protein